MNIIQQEHRDSEKYFLSQIITTDGVELAELSRRNIALVEAMIRHDSDYSNSENTEDMKSSAFWLKELKKILVEKKESQYTYRQILDYCVQYIDSENSTHLNADGVGRKQLRERLEQMDKPKLIEFLRCPNKEGYKLVEILSKKTTVEDDKHHARTNFSFATKFCHYACFQLFEGLTEQDNFSIFDSVVAKHLPKYAKHFSITLPKDYKTNYSSYIALIDAIISKADEPISRNGFDHLLWYFHKAR